MNPVDLGRGKSFKGLSAYLLHDQGAATAERVGWSQSYNLNDASGDRAWRLMAATAMSADALKEAAGKPKTGAKNTKPVYHYTVTWPEADQPSDELQRLAVQESLKVLGLEEHQALAVQHIGEDHPHVHVMVNLVNPEDGTTAKLSYTQKKLRKWADKFEEEHGLKLTEGSRINAKKRESGEKVNARRKPRNIYEQDKREGQDRRSAWLRKQENGIAQTLQGENKALRAHHAGEWASLKKVYYTERDGLLEAKKADIRQTIDQIKERYRPVWAATFRESREQLQRFEQSEKNAVSRLFNIGRTFLRARQEGFDPVTSFVGASMASERRLMVEADNQRREKAVGVQLKRDMKTAVSRIKDDYAIKLTAARERFLADCGVLRATQDEELGRQRGKWREYRERRQVNHLRLNGPTPPKQARAQDQTRGRGLRYGMEPR